MPTSNIIVVNDGYDYTGVIIKSDDK